MKKSVGLILCMLFALPSFAEDTVVTEKTYVIQKCSSPAGTVIVGKVLCKAATCDKLAQYGPQTQDIRVQLRDSVAKWITVVWPEQGPSVDGMQIFGKSPATLEMVINQVRSLIPQNETQRIFQSDAMQICRELQ